MPEIKVLENTIINQIAAGEVVERPASVVKELVENAIDAGATAVSVEIRDGGASLVRVVDNGCGIPAGQLRSAFLRHATSKIRDMNDLENVLTLGFRGEALSSIAGVAQVEVLTKTADADAGARIVINGGEIAVEEPAGCTDGTAFTVRNLFYNVPARRKFLKKAAAESGFISDMLSRMAVGHPEVAFKYVNNATSVLQTSGSGDIKTAIFQVYGRELAEKLIAVDFTREGFRVHGFLARPEMARGNRSYELLFINGRYVKCAIAQSAAEDAYRTRLPIGRFPVFMLHLTMPPAFVDVNVHPTKLEVRFSNERFIYDLVHDAADKALKAENLIPRVTAAPQFHEVAETEVFVGKQTPIEDTPSNPLRLRDPFTPEELAAREAELQKAAATQGAPMPTWGAILQDPAAQSNADASASNTALSQAAPYEAAHSGIPAQVDTPAPVPVANTPMPAVAEAAFKPFFTSYRIIGQAFATYWIVEQNGSLFIIDQHAAHERVLFEGFMKKLKHNEPVPQSTLMPVAVKLSERERGIVRENMAFLESLGFALEDLNEQAIAIRALPYVFENPADTSFFLEIVDVLADGAGVSGDLYDARLVRVATMACKAAVKANDRLSEAEARALLTQLLKLENPFTCPHGRPTVVELTKYEMEKMFKRVQ